MNVPDYSNYFNLHPDRDGRFGKYGGAYLPPELECIMAEIRDAYDTISRSAKFIAELRSIRKHYQGRPTPVYHAERLSRKLGSAQIYLKREDLNHTGAFKLNSLHGRGCSRCI
jgi:tryptophan synthase beta chain